MPLLRRQPSVQPWYRPKPFLRVVPRGVPFTYDRATEVYFIAPAGPYDPASVWDAETEAGNYTIAPLVWSPSGLALTFDADGIPYIGGAYTGRQTFDYREWDVATQDYVPVDGGGTTATYTIGNSTPVLGTIPTQAWAAGVDDYEDLDITDADDALSTLTLTGTINGNAITSSYNADGVRFALHTYLPGDPGEYQRWRLEFSLAHGAGPDSGTISDLTVTDPYGASAVFAAFAWSRVDGVQVPDSSSGTLTYAEYVDLVLAANLVPSEANLALDGMVTPGNVIETEPAYPDYVQEGSQIFITVSAIRIPDVVGLGQEAAEAAILAAGLVPSVLEGHGGAAENGTIFDQSADAEEFALPGDVVFLYVQAYGVELEVIEGVTDYGIHFTQPWEASMGQTPGEVVRYRFPQNFGTLKYIAYDREPISASTKKQIQTQDSGHIYREGSPYCYYPHEEVDGSYILYPKPSVNWANELEGEGLTITVSGDAETSTIGTIGVRTGNSDSISGFSADVVDVEDSVFMVYSVNPRRIDGGQDEPDFPDFLCKYIRYGVAARAYSANTDGRIKSLGEFWGMRYDLGVQFTKRFMRKRRQDRDYRMTTKGMSSRRAYRHPRLPDGYPSV